MPLSGSLTCRRADDLVAGADGSQEPVSLVCRERVCDVDGEASAIALPDEDLGGRLAPD